jgi:hypothetical protein
MVIAAIDDGNVHRQLTQAQSGIDAGESASNDGDPRPAAGSERLIELAHDNDMPHSV